MITIFDLFTIILMMLWMVYRLYVSRGIYKNIVAGVYSKPENAVTIIFIEGIVYLAIVFIFFPFGRQTRGWNFLLWYVSSVLSLWCFAHVIKYIQWKRSVKADEK